MPPLAPDTQVPATAEVPRKELIFDVIKLHLKAFSSYPARMAAEELTFHRDKYHDALIQKITDLLAQCIAIEPDNRDSFNRVMREFHEIFDKVNPEYSASKKNAILNELIFRLMSSEVHPDTALESPDNTAKTIDALRESFATRTRHTHMH